MTLQLLTRPNTFHPLEQENFRSPIGVRKEEPEWQMPSEVWPERFFRPKVVLVLGRRGGGKGLYLQAMCAIMKERYRRWRIPFTIWANYKNTLANIQDPDLVMYLTQFPDEAHNALAVIDEIATATPNRDSMSGINKSFSQFLTQIRKRNIEILAATQFGRVLDIQVLLQVDLIVHVELINGGKGLWLYVWDLWGQYFPGTEHRRPELPSSRLYDRRYRLMGTDRLFPTYNTDEVIAPLRHADRARILRGQGWDIAEEEQADGKEE